MFLGISLLRKQVSPYLLRGSLSYIQWFGCKYSIICEEGLWKNCLRTEISCVRGEIKGSETFIILVLSEKKVILHKNNTPAFY